MIVTCPSCNHSAEATLKTTASAIGVTCPKCRHRFRLELAPEEPVVPDAGITCPKCGVVQQDGESCAACGIVYLKYRPAEETEGPAAPPDAGDDEPPPSMRDQVKWLLTDKSIGNFVWMVVLLVVGTLMASGYGKREAMMKAVREHNRAEMEKAEAGPAKREQGRGVAQDDIRILMDLRTVVSKAREEGDRCLGECRLQVPRAAGDSGKGRYSNPALVEIRRLFHAIPQGKYQAYYESVGSLVATVEDLDNLRLHRDADNFQQCLSETEEEYRESLVDVVRNDPGNSGGALAPG